MNNSTRIRIVGALIVALLILNLAASGLGGHAAASTAGTTQLTPGARVILRADPRNNPYHVAPPAEMRAGVQSAQTATIIVNYIGSWSTQAQTAFQYAVDIWETQITSLVPIVVDATWTTLPPGVLGGAGSVSASRNFPGAPVVNTWYPAALANRLYGSDLDPGNVDIDARFNSGFSNWYFGTDGNTPSGKYDLVSVVLHELGHGLGFVGSMKVGDSCGTGMGCWGFGTGSPFIYDRFAENGSGQILLNTNLFPNPSVALAAQLTSDDIYFDGPATRAANNGVRAKLYAPSTWEQGSSYSHLDEIYNNTQNALMTYSLNAAESIHNPGPIMLGMFEDMGWDGNTPPTLNPLPDQTLPVNTSRDNAIDLWAYASDVQDTDAALTFTISNSPNVNAGVTIDSDRYIDINPTPGYTGTTDVTIQVRDTGGLTDTDTFSVTVVPNPPPVIDGLPDRTVPKNGSMNNAIDLWAYASDVPDPDASLTFTITNSPDINAGVSIDSNHYIDIYPTAGWTGTTDVTVQVEDTGGLTDTDTFSVTVVDTPPTIDGLLDQTLAVNTSRDNAIDLWDYASDAQDLDASLIFTITNTPVVSAGVSLDSNRYIDINPALGWTGQTDVTIQVRDTGGLTDTDTFSVIVTTTEQWMPTALSSYDIRALAIDPSNTNTVYAASASSGIFKTADGGGSWPAVYTRTGSFHSLAIDPTNTSIVYAGHDSTIVKTVDGGANWNSLGNFPPVYALAIDSMNPATVYAGAWAGWGIYKTTNGGANWSSVLSSQDVRSLAIDPTSPSVLYAGTKNYYSTAGGVLKSADGGVSWTRVMTHSQVNALALDPTHTSVIYAGTEGGGVFKSIDGGANWTSINTGLTNNIVRALALDPTHTSVIYAGTEGGGVFRSVNGGASWSSINQGLTYFRVGSLAVAPCTSVVYAGTAGRGVVKRLGSTSPNPTISNLPDLTLLVNTSRDNAIDLWAYACDAQSADSALTFTIDNTPDPSAGVSLPDNRYIDINPAAGWTGQTSVTIRVTDPGGLSSTDTFVVTFSPQTYIYLPAVMKNYSPGLPPTSWVTIISEDFDGSFPGQWDVVDNDGATNGTYYWAKRNCRADTGSYSGWAVGGGTNGAALACGSNYPNNAKSWMVYGPFSLVGASAAELNFRLWLNSELGYDGVCWMASVNGTNFYGTCMSGSNGAWIDRTLDLSNVYTLGNLLGQPNVWIALIFASDGSVTRPEGGYVDNIVLRKCTSGTCTGLNVPTPALEPGQVVEFQAARTRIR